MEHSGLAQNRADIAQDIIERSPAIAIRVTGEAGAWRTVYITKNIAQFGYRREDFLDGKLQWNDIVHPDDRVRLNQNVNRHKQRRIDRYNTVYRIVAADGREVWVNDLSTVVRNGAGEELYSDCIISDYSEAKKSYDIIEDNARQLEVLNDILVSLHDADPQEAFHIVLDRTGNYLDISRVVLFEDSADHSSCRAVYEWCNRGIPSMVQQGPFELHYERDIPDIDQALREQGQYAVNYGDIPDRSRREFDNEEVIAAAIFAVNLGEQRYGFICFDECVKRRSWSEETLFFLGTIARLVSTAVMRRHNLEEKRRQDEIIRQIAYTDHLTKLPNRYRCDVELEEAIASARAAGTFGYVMFLDMDDFKIVNDGYGHDYGDALLLEFADHLTRNCLPGNRVFRLGGDEFVLLIAPENAGRIQESIDRLLERARAQWQVLDKAFYCTISVGVVRFPDGDMGVKEIMKNADIAMYEAKKIGKNSALFYSDNMRNDSLERAEMEVMLRDSIASNCEGFYVVYQPYVDIVRGNALGAEALLRWRAPTGEVFLPDDFIPLCEYLGLIVPLGEFVLREACLLLRRSNELDPGFSMSVNVSLRQLQQQDIVTRIADIIESSGINPHNLILEVTEGLEAKDVQRILILYAELHKIGVQLAMDDFGTGYSSLSNMREIPFDLIKIDRSFIRDIATDAYANTFIRLIASLGHSMDKQVCVEGVETREQLDYCREADADMVQGFFFHHPLPEQQLLEVLERKGRE